MVSFLPTCDSEENVFSYLWQWKKCVFNTCDSEKMCFFRRKLYSSTCLLIFLENNIYILASNQMSIILKIDLRGIKLWIWFHESGGKKQCVSWKEKIH